LEGIRKEGKLRGEENERKISEVTIESEIK
jgi:hypothetical protein